MSVRRVLDLVPRAFAGVAVLVVVIWGLLFSWALADRGDGPGAWFAAAGMLLVVTPVAAALMATVNYAFVSLVLRPVHWLLERNDGSAASSPLVRSQRGRRP